MNKFCFAKFMVYGLAVAIGLCSPVGAQGTVDHTAWDALLKQHVKEDGRLVDYQGIQQERDALERYLATLVTVDPDALTSKEAKLAFWINAYNAYVVKGVLDHYPIASVKEVKGFFDRIRYRVAGRDLTLNGIEGEGRALGDWRIHFAVICASSSCPLIRSEAYVPQRLEVQLAEDATRFLRDPSRGVRWEEPKRILWVSKIFKWYAQDFVPSGKLTTQNLVQRLHSYLDPALVQTTQQLPTLKFLDYDWSLNVHRSSPPR